MTEGPIMMTASSVRAIELGAKTETRRLVEPQPGFCKNWRGPGLDSLRVVNKHGAEAFVPVPIGQAEQDHVLRPMSSYNFDRLWVKQRWRVFRSLNLNELEEKKKFQLLLQYGSDLPTDMWKDCDQESFLRYVHDDEWKNPMFMPRWASRLDLEVLSVRLEQLGDMTEENVRAEGIVGHYAEQLHVFGSGTMGQADPPTWDKNTPLQNFEWYWNIINQHRGHPFRPDLWVWVIRFKRL